MASTAAPPPGFARGETRIFVIMAFVMSAIIIAGFSLNLAMGRSSFAVPLPYHLHAAIFMSWIGIYLAQHVTVATGNRRLHIMLGRLAYLWIPAMVVAGGMMIVVSAQRTGGPFFFAQNEFFISNMAGLLVFGILGWWALRARRHTGWHRRLMLVAMSILTGPGLGRLLPMPMLMPHAWTISFVLTLAFPAIAMLYDLRRDGRVHPAYWWGMGINIGFFAISMLIAASPWGIALTEWLVSGTPGAERPMAAFLPPGFSM